MISRGYDAPAVAVMAAKAGCKEAVTYSKPNGDDDGTPVAAHLGLYITRYDRSEFKRRSGLPEAEFFIHSTLSWAPIRSMEQQLAGTLLLTGAGGDYVWSLKKWTPTKLFQNPAPRQMSVTSIGEFRKRVGFIHFPPAIIAAMYKREINHISKSKEMRPWSLPVSYNRPIPRRIIEEAGVPRELFGQKKMASAYYFLRKIEHLSQASQEDFLNYLNETIVPNARSMGRISLSLDYITARFWSLIERMPIVFYRLLMPYARHFFGQSQHPNWQRGILFTSHWGFDRIKDRYRIE